LRFVQRLVALRREHPAFRRRKFFQGREIRGADIKDIQWFEPSGREMTDEAWNSGFVRSFGVQCAGHLLGELSDRGEPIKDDNFLMLFNAHTEPLPFSLSATAGDGDWELVFDTADPDKEGDLAAPSSTYLVRDRSVVVFKKGLEA
jgi:glycogen operon protein